MIWWDLLGWLNQQHDAITFTEEQETKDKLPFLDVLVTRSSHGSITTNVYRKPTYSGLYMKWDSFVPKSYKKGLVNCLIFRAWKICSNFSLFHQELQSVKSTLMANGYPSNFVDSIVRRFLDKQYSPSLPSYGPDRKVVYFCLPFTGEWATKKFSRQIRRLIAKVASHVELRLVFRAAQRLSCLSKLKASFDILCRSGVVYKVSCLNCSAFYVGKTKRRLKQRLHEHSTQDYSSLHKHSVDFGHGINYDNPEILTMDNSDFRLSIKEAIKIKDLNAHKSLNANVRSCELKLW